MTSPSDPDFDPSSPEVRLRDLEQAMAQMIWLFEEKRQQVDRLAAVVAALLAQQMQPKLQEQLQEQIKAQLAGKTNGHTPGWLSQVSPETRG